MRDMKVGDLLTQKIDLDCVTRPLLLVLEIKEHPDTPERDRICLQWMNRNGYLEKIQGEFSRHIVENRYKVI